MYNTVEPKILNDSVEERTNLNNGRITEEEGKKLTKEKEKKGRREGRKEGERETGGREEKRNLKIRKRRRREG